MVITALTSQQSASKAALDDARMLLLHTYSSMSTAKQKRLKHAHLDMSNPRSSTAPIQGLPNPTLDTLKPELELEPVPVVVLVPSGKSTDAASVGGGNLGLDDDDHDDHDGHDLLLLLLNLRRHCRRERDDELY